MTGSNINLRERARMVVLLWTLPLLLVMSGAAPVHAAASWTMARRDDAGIIKLVKALNKKLASRPELKSEPAFVLLNNDVYKVDMDSHKVFSSQVIQVNDLDHPDIATRKYSIFAKAKIPYIGAWILRDGKVLRMGEEIRDVVPGDKTSATEIILAFPDVRPGDVLGVSIEKEYDFPWGGGYLQIAESVPVMMSRTRIQTKGKMAYRMVGMNLRRDKWGKKIIEKKHDVPCDVKLTITDIPAIPRGKYVPNFHEYLPYIMTTLRGFWDKDMHHWIFNVSWNEVAVRSSGFREYLDENCGETLVQARSVAAGCATPGEKAAAVHRYIRDDVVDVSFFEVRDQKRGIKEILESGQATRMEKGMLMYSMCKALGLKPRVYLGRNRDYGGLDKGNPYMNQFTDVVVALSGDEVRYFVPAEGTCPPGVLPCNLRGMEVMECETDMWEKMREAHREAFDAGGSHQERRWLAYVDLIKKKDWVKWSILPGDPDEVASSTLEVIRYVPGKDEISVQVTGEGFCDLRHIVESEGPANDHLASYLESRLPTATVVSAEVGDSASSDAPVEMSGRIEIEPLPAVMGDSWILPGDSVFGTVFLDDWDADADAPFQMRMAREHKFVWKTKLPANWENIRALPGLEVDHPNIQYKCLVLAKDGELVVTRTCRLKRGMLWSRALDDFAETIRKIQDFERNPIVLEKKAG